MLSRADKKLIKRLAVLTTEAGERGPAELRAALQKLLTGRSDGDRSTFLAELSKAVQREFHRCTLTIESAAELPEELVAKIVAKFSDGPTKPLRVVQTLTPELIAGLRVRMGDIVYDASVLGHLNSLASRIH